MRAPKLIAVNGNLAQDLGLDPEALCSDEGVAILAGNAVPDGAFPLAQAYAGHQFAGWVPQLGDGRAILLGEVVDHAGQRRDIQLKGAGRTPFSRNGDGRAWLGPVLREYVVSEAMHALGVPTTRALAAVETGETVQRETGLPGAVLTRVASSHIRVGTFQYFAARQDIGALTALFEHVVARHYPGVSDALELLQRIVERQANLIAQWMGLGFIHGVMNTDNMTVSGETIDYGPCAFMDMYHPERVFSSIDQYGRYAYSNQPRVAPWNLAQLASSLLPLMGEKDAAIDAATAAINRFPDMYTDAYRNVFARKFGISQVSAEDDDLVAEFLTGLAENGADFTNSFRGLVDGRVPAGLEDWGQKWQARLAQTPEDPSALMVVANPAFIPRNHQIERMIHAAVGGDYALFHRLNDVLATPYADQPDAIDLAAAPSAEETVTQTFCGT